MHPLGDLNITHYPPPKSPSAGSHDGLQPRHNLRHDLAPISGYPIQKYGRTTPDILDVLQQCDTTPNTPMKEIVNYPSPSNNIAADHLRNPNTPINSINNHYVPYSDYANDFACQAEPQRVPQNVSSIQSRSCYQPAFNNINTNRSTQGRKLTTTASGTLHENLRPEPLDLPRRPVTAPTTIQCNNGPSSYFSDHAHHNPPPPHHYINTFGRRFVSKDPNVDWFRPRYNATTGEWVLYLRSLPNDPAIGHITRAARKNDRWQMEFYFSNGEHRKFYLCHICLHQGESDVWIGYKNFVHQHIPRNHANEACLRCPVCAQPVYTERIDSHIRSCKRKFAM